MSLLARFALLCNSYFLLLVIILVEKWSSWPEWARYLGIGVLGADLVVMVLIIWIKRSSAPNVKRIVKAQSLNHEVIAYLFTYVIALIGLSKDYQLSWASIVIFCLMLVILYLRTDIVHINPTLLALGLKSFRVETEDGQELVVLTYKSRLRPGMDVRLVKLEPTVFIEAHEDGGSDARGKSSS